MLISKIFPLLFLMLLISTSLAAQIYGKIAVGYEISEVKFSAELIDSVYNPNDTLKIYYSVTNNSDTTMILFRPRDVYEKSIYNPDCNRYIFDFGGAWYYDIGYEQNVRLIFLEPSEKYEQLIYLVLSRKIIDSEFCNSVWKRRKEINLSNIAFDVGLIPESDEVRFKHVDETGFAEFKAGPDEYYFDANLLRFYLGPLRFKINKH